MPLGEYVELVPGLVSQLEAIDRLLADELAAWNSYNARATTLASLAGVALSIVVSVGKNVGEIASGALGTVIIVGFVATAVCLVAAVGCAIACLFPRSQAAANRRDEYLAVITAYPPIEPDEFDQVVLEYAGRTLQADHELVIIKRRWVERGFQLVGVAMLGLLVQAVGTALA